MIVNANEICKHELLSDGVRLTVDIHRLNRDRDAVRGFREYAHEKGISAYLR